MNQDIQAKVDEFKRKHMVFKDCLVCEMIKKGHAPEDLEIGTRPMEDGCGVVLFVRVKPTTKNPERGKRVVSTGRSNIWFEFEPNCDGSVNFLKEARLVDVKEFQK